MMNGDLVGVREWGGRAIELAERLDETEVLVAGLVNVGTVELGHGLDEGRVKLLRGLKLALDAGLHRHAAVTYCNLVASSREIRDYETALALLPAGLAFCDEHDLMAWDIYLGGWAAHIALDHGRWEEAAERARENLERTHGSLPHSRFRSLLVLGLLYARRGEADPWPELDEALAIATNANELDTLGPIAVARAEARWLTGGTSLIAEETAGTLARAEDSDQRWLIGELALWRHRAGLSRAGGDRLPGPYRAELAGDVHVAAEFWRGCGCRYEAALALAGSDEEDDLRESLRELQQLGTRPAAAIVARRLRERGARGVQLGPRSATRANPAGLTARELDVLALVIRGDRNAEIASQLFLSQKTVEHHVSAILRKLGARTRGQAATEAIRLGLAER
jgi:DNA-binding CsgD family transcriptional regulator